MVEAKKTTKKVAKKKSSKKASSKKASTENRDLFAVIKTGGKQYQVKVGDVVKVEIEKGKKEGDSITFDSVLLVDDGKDTSIGSPYISGAKVSGEIEKIEKNKKTEVSKFKSKSRYLVRRGHRQPLMTVRITAIK